MGSARSILAAAVFAAVVVAVLWSGVFDDFSVAGMRSRIEAWGALGPLVFMAIVVAGFFVPGPEMVLMALGGAVFGTIEGFAYGWCAAVVGTVIPFLLVRQAVGRYVQRADGIRFRRLRAVDQRLVERGFVTVLGLRLVLCMAPPLNWALGATRVKLRDYVLGTAVGITPGIGMSAYLGESLTAATSWSELLTPDVLAVAGVVVALFVGGAVVGRRIFGAPQPG
jgi:uncharacterized membrane protein YdjX (TVP38/TMEM64 family)